MFSKGASLPGLGRSCVGGGAGRPGADSAEIAEAVDYADGNEHGTYDNVMSVARWLAMSEVTGGRRKEQVQMLDRLLNEYHKAGTAHIGQEKLLRIFTVAAAPHGEEA